MFYAQIAFFSVFSLFAACGSSANKSESKKDVDPVLRQTADEASCDRFAEGEVKVLRRAQTLMCLNNGDAGVVLELASEPSEDSGTKIVYDLPARGSQKFTLPFIDGFTVNDIYARLDRGEWRKLCRGSNPAEE